MRKDKNQNRMPDSAPRPMAAADGRTGGSGSRTGSGGQNGTGGTDNRKSRTDKEILLITYIFVLLFVALIGKMVYFVGFQSDSVINTSYNHRQDVLAKRITRGKILAAGGEVLAETVKSSKGKETRRYPYGRMFVHVVGRFKKGKTGVEASEDFTLLTSHENVLTNALREISGEKIKGDNIVLTLNYKIQKAAYDALGNYKGAVVVLNPSTGAVLAMVSKPDYDPNDVSSEWESLNSDSGAPLLNRATQGLYPPGSTFKILTALEYIREYNYEDFVYKCKGSTKIEGIPIKCYKNEVHGKLTLMLAFAKSCNCAFAYIGDHVNMASFRALCNSFYFNTQLPTELVTSKSSYALSDDPDPEDIPQTMIGQGETMVSPLHMAMIAASVANNGVMMRPYVIDRVESSSGTKISETTPSAASTVMTADEAKIMKKLMRACVTDGTGYALSSASYTAAGKTGSAEYDSEGNSHAWFVGFAPVKNPQVAIAVIVEGAGTGSDYAVPIAKKVLDAAVK